MILWSLILQTATADIKPYPTPQMVPIHHQLIVQGLEAHPEHVLLITPEPANGTISTSRVLNHEASQVVLAEGDGHSAQIWRPVARWMSREDYDQWKQNVTQIIAAQREACDDRGEGCPHISRFEPSYAPPNAGVLCTLELPELTRESKTKDVPFSTDWPEPKVQQHVFSITEVSSETCILSPVTTQNTEDSLMKTNDQWAALAPATGVSGLLIGALLLRSRRGTDTPADAIT